MYGVSFRSSPEAYDHSVLLYVIPQTCVWNFPRPKQTGILYVGISGLNIIKHFTGKGYGFIVLEEYSTEAILTGIGLQDKGLCVVIICQSGPEKHVTNPGLQAVKSLICGGVPVPICYLFP